MIMRAFAASFSGGRIAASRTRMAYWQKATSAARAAPCNRNLSSSQAILLVTGITAKVAGPGCVDRKFFICRSCARVPAWLYEQDGRLLNNDERALREAIGALGLNAGRLLSAVLLRHGEDELDATLGAFTESARALAVETARKSQEAQDACA